MPGKRELKTKKRFGVLLPAAAGAAVLGVLAGFCAAANLSVTMAPNTVIAGEDVGGLTRTEASWVVSSALDDLRRDAGVHALLEDGSEAAYLTYEEMGVTFDTDTLTEDAYRSSHTGNVVVDGWNLLTASLGRTSTVTPRPSDGWEGVAAQKLAEAANTPAVDFSYEMVDDQTLRMHKAKNGRDVNRAVLAEVLKNTDADEYGSRSVLLPYVALPGDPGDLVALNDTLGGEGMNASYDAETQSIVPERPALQFDLIQAQSLLDAALPGTYVDMPAKFFAPEITAEQLEKVLFRDLLGTYTTRVGGAAGRKANVRLTAQRVNGVVLNSGEEFNYYALTGPFSAANGYQSAPGYLHGKTVEMDGGGACQCSSTTYAAALLANLEIVARTAHGFASDYIGLGLDATVSGGGPEFIFRNNTLYPIKVETFYSDNNRLTVNIYGTKTDNITVKMRTEVLSTTPFEEIVEEDPTLAPGERVVEQTAYTGYVVNTYRQLYEDGKLISEKLEARSNYKKRDRIIKVGPSVAPASAPVVQAVAPLAPASEIPGGIDPTPISEQLNHLPQP